MDKWFGSYDLDRMIGARNPARCIALTMSSGEALPITVTVDAVRSTTAFVTSGMTLNAFSSLLLQDLHFSPLMGIVTWMVESKIEMCMPIYLCLPLQLFIELNLILIVSVKSQFTIAISWPSPRIAISSRTLKVLWSMTQTRGFLRLEI